MAKWKRIVIHCSASSWGSVAEVRKWHIEGNGWVDIGYQYLVSNGQIRPDYYLPASNGSLEIGRQIDGDNIVESGEQGAHAYGYNSDSIGICLIGNDQFTVDQISKLIELVVNLMNRFEIQLENVVRHYELDPRKTCPNIEMDSFRKLLKGVKL